MPKFYGHASTQRPRGNGQPRRRGKKKPMSNGVKSALRMFYRCIIASLIALVLYFCWLIYTTIYEDSIKQQNSLLFLPTVEVRYT